VPFTAVQTTEQYTMDDAPTRIEWMERFAGRPMELRPGMNSITAATHAVEVYSAASDVPESEAERFAESQYPRP
jgi:hypothetical protein